MTALSTSLVVNIVFLNASPAILKAASKRSFGDRTERM
jgi:hypothetical protein